MKFQIFWLFFHFDIIMTSFIFQDNLTNIAKKLKISEIVNFLLPLVISRPNLATGNNLYPTKVQ